MRAARFPGGSVKSPRPASKVLNPRAGLLAVRRRYKIELSEFGRSRSGLRAGIAGGKLPAIAELAGDRRGSEPRRERWARGSAEFSTHCRGLGLAGARRKTSEGRNRLCMLGYYEKLTQQWMCGPYMRT